MPHTRHLSAEFRRIILARGLTPHPPPLVVTPIRPGSARAFFVLDMARPTTYSEELATTICVRIAEGESLRKICADEAMPSKSTASQWLIRHKEFAEQMAIARDLQADHYADEIIEISDTPEVGAVETDKLDKDGKPYTEVRRGDMVEHRRMRIDARKWYAEKVAPKKYGNRQKIEHTGDGGGPLSVKIYMPSNGRDASPEG